jgi:3-isopropylmalate/(R)-2-methylmalate dehydratase small subunit
MEPLRIVMSVAAPFPATNINTDDIFPAEPAPPFKGDRMALLDPEKMGPQLFGMLRWNRDATPRADFVLNRTPWDKAQILIAGENFGCGSSREHAVWALKAVGFRVVIAPSFGDIFFANCFRNGLLPVRMAPETVDAYLEMARDPVHPPFTVDLASQAVRDPAGRTTGFAIEESRRDALLRGLDEVAMTLEGLPEILEWERAYFSRHAWLDRARVEKSG